MALDGADAALPRFTLLPGDAQPPDEPESFAPPDERSAFATMPRHQLLRTLGTSARGLEETEAEHRALVHGENSLVAPPCVSTHTRILAAARNPFVLLLAALAVVAAAADNGASALVIGTMAAVSCVLRVRQERRGERAAAALRALVSASATVVRRAGPHSPPRAREVSIEQLVPGDIVNLAPGDLVPADLYLLRGAGLTVAEGVLTGESRPAAKSVPPASGPDRAGAGGTGPGRPWLCPMGGVVAHGTGTGVVIATGAATGFGAAHAVSTRPGPAATAFDRGVKRVTALLLAFMAIAVPVAMIALAGTRGIGSEVLEFTLAVAVGLTPEMLPVVTTAVMTRAARAMAGAGIVVRRLPAIHNLGAMDTLCVDKTGTLTEGRPSVVHSLDPVGGADSTALLWARRISEAVGSLAPGVLDAYDGALLRDESRGADGLADTVTIADASSAADPLDVLDVLPFDPRRRRASALFRVTGRLGTAVIATRGAVREVLDACSDVLKDGERYPLDDAERGRLLRLGGEPSVGEPGQLRLLAVAVRELSARARSKPLRPEEEQGLTLVGFVALRDRPKAAAAPALARLSELGVEVKVVTGDAPSVAAAVCADVGAAAGRIVTGSQIDACDDDRLRALVLETSVFARTTPAQKVRVVAALRAAGRVTGFLGDGVNDAPALRAADVGIAVRDGSDLAVECADVVLGEKDLAGLADAVAQCRRAGANAVKYLKITISANLGNALSLLLAALLLPFLPMLPFQVLVQNLCFDLSQLALSVDRVSARETARPRAFAVSDLVLFALLLAPANTLADVVTFQALGSTLGVGAGAAGVSAGVKAAMYAGWFAENLLTQAFAVHLLRTRRLAWRDRAATPVILATVAVAVAAFALPLVVQIARPLGFAALPVRFYPMLAAIVLGYCALTIAARGWYFRLTGARRT
jgi:Mg2+-importing ATPase